MLYVLAKHFPDRAKQLTPRAIDNIAGSLAKGYYNTHSSAMTILALDASGRVNATSIDKLAITEWRAGVTPKDISTAQSALMRSGAWSADATRVEFGNHSGAPAWWSVVQSGYDRKASDKAIREGLEIVREYTDRNGKPLTGITVGDEVEVHLKIRTTNNASAADLAIVDLLPGGFDPVDPPPPSGDAGENPDHPASVAVASLSTWHPEHTDQREDRMVLYGTVTPAAREFVYRIRATNAGRYVVPPAYGESMYDRRIKAQSTGGATLTVQPAHRAES
ncbi:Large extracellular alpha-helical protein [Candidatus Burkholderia verschuerenii]|uniref:Large extracellular alpha-helical protein n=1 Tax=Candidatus Burkholderia verschuerenii TaxID=242163 RepID=A0A0L0MDN8_9BURK|nr:hypothetical protein [Candidatus Burkholderia verschuerenii]KND60453.1 Large extracellular alpha-helical protein [Candidatus Burkholderia verschuerenii]